MPQRALIAELTTFFGQIPLDRVIARFDRVECCLSPVLDLGEAVASPHHVARGLVRRDSGGALQALFPALVDGMPPAPRPALDETDVDAILPPVGAAK